MKPDADTHVELEGVCKRYRTRDVLVDTELVVRHGEFLVVLGRSGSGKSTLLKLIGSLERADAGSIRHDGQDIGKLTERDLAAFRRHSLGFVFQFFNLVPTLTVLENVRLPLALNGLHRGAQLERAREALIGLGLDAVADRFPDELSGGEQQRVAIGRALVHTPGLLIADEPTGNLDDETADRVLDRLEASCRERGTTLIVATHSNAIAERADRVLRILHGRLAPAAP